MACYLCLQNRAYFTFVMYFFLAFSQINILVTQVKKVKILFTTKEISVIPFNEFISYNIYFFNTEIK